MGQHSVCSPLFEASPPESLKLFEVKSCLLHICHPIFSPKQASTLCPSKSFTLESERRIRTYFERMPGWECLFQLEIPIEKMS